ncbi:hypothetical protein K458DRAFT_425062 [Lentithecium fluviatile CBS 122367]|uniref:AA1-like domain-containing protein n=1 Tax=Lentithecium fluviatile CBS 122367 TaxID=1168545 RepID=A0A6G1ICN2_9PLEO|nr:hypothetical protein K458DRAFT_425062 [Lentithecium fluviatile CBS 122367]
MRLTLFTTLSLAAATSAAVLPREDADMGSWDATYNVISAANGYKSTKLTAVYSNSQLSEPITATCSYEYNPTADPKETSSCDPESFSYSLGVENNDQVLSLTQTVELWGEQVTVFGDAPIIVSCASASGRSCSGETTVKVTKAIA